MASTVLSVFDVAPRRVGGVEMLSAEVSRQLRAIGWRSCLAFPAEPTALVEQFLKESGAEIFVAAEISAGGLPAVAKMASLVRETKAQHVHLSFTPPISPLPWACRVGGAKGVYFTDQSSRDKGQSFSAASGIRKSVGRFLTSPFNMVFCVSDYVRNHVASRGYVPPERLTTLYNSIDFSRVVDREKGEDFRRKLGIGIEKTLISQVSWLRPEKGLEDFIRAAALAHAEDRNVHFCIAGDGQSRDDLVALTKQLGIEKIVTFAGLVEDPMGDGLYAASDMTCQLSRWEEAFAWVIAEAMAHSKPVIGTRVGGIPEVIDDGVTGFVVPPESSADVAQRILELSRDRALRQSMGAAGYQRAWKRFNLSDNVGRLLVAYGAASQQTAPKESLSVRSAS